MILQVTIENFKSINKQIVFSCVATSEAAHKDYLYEHHNLKILPTALIIGTNGAGKTNLFLSMSYLQDMLRNKTISFFPHKLNENVSTKIDIQFIHKCCRYAYGIEILKNQVLVEYLYTIDDKINIIFERDLDNYHFSEENFSTFHEIIKNNNTNQCLFLTLLNEALQMELIQHVYEYLTNKIIVVIPNQFDEAALFKYALENYQEYPLIDEMLDKMDMGIKRFIKCDNHILAHYPNFDMDILEESSGVKKVFTLLVLISDVLMNGKVLIIDELEKNLHQVLVKYLIKLFTENKSNQAQLIFSTHNSSLLNLNLFRKDQIWFMEKDMANFMTVLFSLTSFKDVKEDEDIEKGYLYGRYGATYSEVKKYER